MKKLSKKIWIIGTSKLILHYKFNDNFNNAEPKKC